ncbi:succinate dehydrogenase assembly factor 4, mitochondrial [Gouania willdenowi]|uniref:Succinate dehydrogenase assembly factor 4, mitochondrial n=1 Tax=Gouania willdenowi TaxID=441366 RepID=A0A8C5E3T2_GOUWI|nr:succinate dehydrogenase assembly factor 4, mitochondrial [Gouania willdenowi]
MALLRGCATAGRLLLTGRLSVLTVSAGQNKIPASFLVGSTRASSKAVKDAEPLRKAKTPQGRFDKPEEEKSSDVLQKFPDNVNPITKERGGPRGPEPTRYGDWERKGRCVDF